MDAFGAIEIDAGFKLLLDKGLQVFAVVAPVVFPHDAGRGIDKPFGSADGFVATEVAVSRGFTVATFTDFVILAVAVEVTGGLALVSTGSGLLFSSSAREAETAKASVSVGAVLLDARVAAAGFLSSV